MKGVAKTAAFLVALSLGAVALSPATGVHARGTESEFHHGWVRPTPPGTTITAMYGTIVNGGETARRLMRVHCDRAESVEIHELVKKGEMMHMRQVKGGLAIPAGGELHFQPGGYHLMLIGLKSPAKPGEQFHAVFFFDNGERMTAVAAVAKVGEIPGGLREGHWMQHQTGGRVAGGHPGEGRQERIGGPAAGGHKMGGGKK